MGSLWCIEEKDFPHSPIHYHTLITHASQNTAIHTCIITVLYGAVRKSQYSPKALFIWSRAPETTLPLETTLRNVYMEL